VSVIWLVNKIWRSHPWDLTLFESLEKKGAMTDADLFDLVREKHDELGLGDFNSTLMKMEVSGLIHVSTLTKGKRRVELVKHKQ
jgi:hypothetical protein